MKDRSRSDSAGSGAFAISRRDLLRMGGTMTAAGILLPKWVTAVAQTAPSTFDYYISPTGNDSNAGTLAAPWAITSLSLFSHTSNNVANCRATAGKRVGLLPGTYNISGMMYGGSSAEATGALQFIGGTSSNPTYIASCNASGAYSPRTATITAKSASGVYGGGISSGAGSWDGPMIAHNGQYPTNYATGNLVIDGLVLTGFSYKAIRIGGGSSGDGPTGFTNVTVQNCELTGGNCSGNPIDNCAAIWIDCTTGAVVQNNYIHDNIGPTPNSADHLNAIIVWGTGGFVTSGTVIQFNTCVNAGSIFGKEISIQGTTVAYNYIDVSKYTAQVTAYGIQDFTGAPTTGMSQTTSIHNNIILSSGFGIGRSTLSDNYGWSTPVNVYNNTIVLTNAAGGAGSALWMTAQGGGEGHVKVYNNIYTGVGGGWMTAFLTDPRGPAVWDYNLFKASGMSWALRTDGSLSSVLGNYSTLASFAAALAANGGIAGVDSHGVANDTPGFVGSGSLAAAYQLASGSPAQGRGSTTGTSSGSATDMGAWGNGATQVGCNFTAGSTTSGNPVPMAPTLSVS
jgi:hypothetical protein